MKIEELTTEEIVEMEPNALIEVALKEFNESSNVVIVETSELYGEEEDDDVDNPFYMKPMYEAYIEDENGDEVDDTRTGRYADIRAVLDEISGTVEA